MLLIQKKAQNFFSFVMDGFHGSFKIKKMNTFKWPLQFAFLIMLMLLAWFKVETWVLTKVKYIVGVCFPTPIQQSVVFMDKNMDRALLPINLEAIHLYYCTILEWVTKMCFCGESVCCFVWRNWCCCQSLLLCEVCRSHAPKPVHFFMFPVWLTFWSLAMFCSLSTPCQQCMYQLLGGYWKWEQTTEGHS
jgi:hypothetical protein